MAASEAVGVIIGAVIGAGGAVITQIVAAAATGRQEQTRLDWEMRKQEREWALRKHERFLTLKQELYSKVVFAGDRLDGYALRIIDSPGAVGNKGTTAEDLADFWRVRTDIDLLVPKAIGDDITIAGGLFSFLVDAKPGEDLKALPTNARNTWTAARDAMRADLQGDVDRVERAKVEKADVDADARPVHHWWSYFFSRRSRS